MGKLRITVTIDHDIEDWLVSASNCYGRSMSEIIRICLREFRDRQPNRFSTADKARSENPEPWRVLRKDVAES